MASLAEKNVPIGIFPDNGAKKLVFSGKTIIIN